MRAGIGIYDDCGGVKVITVERDGNPAFVGSILYAKYQTTERVKKLFKLGDLYDLREGLKPTSSIGHYILKNGDKVEEIRLQEGITVSKHRDIRQIEDNIIRKNKPIRPREYSNAQMAFICEGLDYLYMFDDRCEKWETWSCSFKTGQFAKIKIDYVTLIRNLVYRDDISSLTKEEKEKLKYLSKR